MIPRLLPTEKTDPDLVPFRPGLLFGCFNAMTWQIGIGTPMVLFCEALGASAFQVGLAYSFVLVLTPIQILATTLLPRFGFKKVMLGGWASRSVFLIVPLWLAIVAPRWGVQPWMAPALVGSVFWFCFFRTIGAASIMPWLYAILPPKVRGRYFGSDQLISGISGVVTLVVSVVLFAQLNIFTALLIQYGIALGGSFMSFMSLRRLPEAPNPEPIGLGKLWRDTPRHMFRPSPFRHYLWLAVAYGVLTMPIPPFLAYFLKVGPGLDPGQIMSFEVLRYCGVIVAAGLIRRRIDEKGARPFFLLSMMLYLVVGGAWSAYLLDWWHLLGGIYAAYFVLGLAAACWTIANLKYLAQVVEEKERTLMVSVQGAVTATFGGLSPILWGLVLKGDPAAGAAINLPVLLAFFLLLMGSVVVLSSLLAHLPEEEGPTPASLVIGHALLRPFRAASYVASLLVTDPGKPGPDEREPARASR